MAQVKMAEIRKGGHVVTEIIGSGKRVWSVDTFPTPSGYCTEVHLCKGESEELERQIHLEPGYAGYKHLENVLLQHTNTVTRTHNAIELMGG